jgi:CheY-like chemotaxis protein
MAKILVVDDSEDYRIVLAMHLERAGHVVTGLPNGKEALVHVIAQTPDAVVLDLLMPEMDGPSFLEVVRSYLRLHALPVVVLTGLPESPMVEHARFLKVNSILTKGKASLDDIESAVKEALVRVPG